MLSKTKLCQMSVQVSQKSLTYFLKDLAKNINRYIDNIIGSEYLKELLYMIFDDG